MDAVLLAAVAGAAAGPVAVRVEPDAAATRLDRLTARAETREGQRAMAEAVAILEQRSHTPHVSQDRIERIAKIAAGYVYYVSLKGVTGAGSISVDATGQSGIPGLYAAGDAGTAVQSVAVATGSGARAAYAINAELALDHEQFVSARERDVVEPAALIVGRQQRRDVVHRRPALLGVLLPALRRPGDANVVARMNGGVSWTRAGGALPTGRSSAARSSMPAIPLTRL